MNIILRKFTPEDKENYLICYKEEPDNRDYNLDGLGGDIFWGFEFNELNRKSYVIALEDNTFCGHLTIYLDHDMPEIGIGLLPEYQGHGYAKAALKLLTEEQDPPVIYRINVNSENKHSIRLMEKIGAVCVSGKMDSLIEHLKNADGDFSFYIEALKDLKLPESRVLEYTWSYNNIPTP